MENGATVESKTPLIMTRKKKSGNDAVAGTLTDNWLVLSVASTADGWRSVYELLAIEVVVLCPDQPDSRE